MLDTGDGLLEPKNNKLARFILCEKKKIDVANMGSST